jgi:rhodanese-related sulfurtransferase/predicted small secreted protein
MKIKLLTILLIAIFSITLTSCAQNTAKKDVKSTGTKVIQKQPIVELISPIDLKAKLGDIQLIDVRTPKEYNNGHIKNAVNINFYDDDFYNQMSKLDKDKEIYIYCRSGGRSGRAAKKLKTAGFTKVYDLQGGFINWNKNNLEVIK